MLATCGSPADRAPQGRQAGPWGIHERAPLLGSDLMRADELRPVSLFDGLTDGQLAELARDGTEVRIEPGVELFREGEHADFWWVLVDGAIDLLRQTGREVTLVGRMDVPGRWAGGFRAWDEQGVYLATGRGSAAGRVLRVPASALRERVTAWFPFGKHLIEGLYGTARSIEAAARQRQSLVTLGTLAAGLAHEINNPAAAAARAVDDLETACQTLLSSLGRLAREEISARQFTALDTLRGEIEPGIPVGTLEDGVWHGVTVVTKAGGFGTPDTLLDVVRALGVSSPTG